MKSLFIAMAVFAMVATSCQQKSSQNHSGTHTHEDGTVHEGESHNEAVEQTSFKVNEEQSTAAKACCEEGCKDCSTDCKSDSCCKDKAKTTGCTCKKEEATKL